MSVSQCNNPLNIDLWQPKWKRLIQKLDLISYHCSMPLLENVHISLEEINKVRKVPFQENEIWGLLCQGIDAIEYLFIIDRAHKDGTPTNLVTPSTYLCTTSGRVILNSCSVDDVKHTIYWCDTTGKLKDFNDNVKIEEKIEKMYIYSLGQTLITASKQHKSDDFAGLSSSLRETLLAMTKRNMSKRISLSGVIDLCHSYSLCMEAPHFIIKKLYCEVIESLPENDILNDVEDQILKENEIIRKKTVAGAENEKICEVTITNDGVQGMDKSAKNRWRGAYAKIIDNKRVFGVAFDNIEDSNLRLQKWQNHEAFDTITKVRTELFERRKMLELLRLSINLPMDESKLDETIIPKSLGDLVLLLRKSSTASSNHNFDNQIQSKESRVKNFVRNSLYKIKNRVNVGPEFVLNSLKPAKELKIAIDNLSDNDIIRLTVILLNGVKYYAKCGKETTISEILQAICAEINFSSTDTYLLGLAFKYENEYLFVSNSKTVIDLQNTSLAPNRITLYLRFKFYWKNINFSRNEFTLHSFYLQLRQDLLQCISIVENKENAVQLSGYALQAEFGDHSSEFPSTYFLLEHYFQKWFVNSFDDRETLKEKAIRKHISCCGLSAFNAEMQFINQCFNAELYGRAFHKVLLQKNDKSSAVVLGVHLQGIDICEERIRKSSDDQKRKKLLQCYTWSEILKISYTDTYFCITPRTETITGWHVKYKFYNDISYKSHSLFEITTEMHRMHITHENLDKVAQQTINFDCDRKSLQAIGSKYGIDPPKVIITGVKR
ncbi:tyrosine-protein phosphatase non-receptor type 13-like isoform X8 [Dinothrombium tinctorium]|uniref:Tyrosine-protein phosphatase non-receptor type 13-like isoform X4 n=1 Tax=Dinothrombium tinctorium TaxID=1965070 RepID=A0A3S3P3R8_9ACAR|nr:tyrosine-protein phosphatase non-receptor type 13-like isoform X4 [Dinothrombium tinctorium]RWS16285.1 tyrosine-protein phosphatase non-receptor type 13-like isoform X8 [Dinothrombium tinctorium]